MVSAISSLQGLVPGRQGASLCKSSSGLGLIAQLAIWLLAPVWLDKAVFWGHNLPLALLFSTTSMFCSYFLEKVLRWFPLFFFIRVVLSTLILAAGLYARERHRKALDFLPRDVFWLQWLAQEATGGICPNAFTWFNLFLWAPATLSSSGTILLIEGHTGFSNLTLSGRSFTVIHARLLEETKSQSVQLYFHFLSL